MIDRTVRQVRESLERELFDEDEVPVESILVEISLRTNEPG